MSWYTPEQLAAGNVWTADRIEQARVWWISGKSAGEIAALLGGCSRASVIGKMHRLGLSGKGGHFRGEAAAPKPRKPVSMAAEKPTKPRVIRTRSDGMVYSINPPLDLPPLRAVKAVAEPVSLFARPFNGCCYPVSGDGADLMVCGAAGQERNPGARPLCDDHYLIFYDQRPLSTIKAARDRNVMPTPHGFGR